MRYKAFGILSIVFCAAFSAAHADGPPLDGDMSKFKMADYGQPTVPGFVLDNMYDQPVQLSAFRGKIVVVNLWATWCPPCIKELPSLDSLQASFNPNDVVILPVSVDHGGLPKVLPFLQKASFHNVSAYVDEADSISQYFKAIRIPYTVIIGRDGREIGHLTGIADWDSSEAKALISYFERMSPPSMPTPAPVTTVARVMPQQQIISSPGTQTISYYSAVVR